MAFQFIEYPSFMIKNYVIDMNTRNNEKLIYIQKNFKFLFKNFFKTVIKSFPASAIGFLIFELTLKNDK
jgi:hypothetical protein